MADAFTRLQQAKENTRWLLDHPDGLVDMKGLAYWAKRVVAIREEIKALL